MVLDSLRYWVQECHVDGFRFDLAVALARGRTTTTTPTTPSSWRCAPTRCSRAPSSSPSRGTSASTAGAPGSSRRRSRSGTTATATRSAPSGCATSPRPRRAASATACASSRPGSPGRRTSSTARPGHHRVGQLRHRPRRVHRWPTSRSTTRKHNGANGRAGPGRLQRQPVVEPRRRGTAPTTRDIAAARRRSMRNLLGTLLLSTGVPMLNAGDELGRSQRGNNNPYSQDNEIVLDRLGPRAVAGGPARDHPPPRAAAARPRRSCASGRSSPAGRSTPTARPTSRGSAPTASRWASAGTDPRSPCSRGSTTGPRSREQSVLIVVNGSAGAVDVTLPAAPGRDGIRAPLGQR